MSREEIRSEGRRNGEGKGRVDVEISLAWKWYNYPGQLHPWMVTRGCPSLVIVPEVA